MEVTKIVELMGEYIALKNQKLEVVSQDHIEGESLTCYTPVVLTQSGGIPTSFLLPLATTGPMAVLINKLFEYQTVQFKMIQKQLDDAGISTSDLHLAVTIYTLAIVDDGLVADLFSSNNKRSDMFELMRKFYKELKDDPRLIMGGVVTMIPSVKMGLTVINTAVNYILRVKHQFLYVETYLDKTTGEFNKQELFDDLDFRLGVA